MQPMHSIPARGGLNFDEAPFLAIWEVTQSCDLACKHCRAAAQPIAHPDQLSTEEGKALIDQIAGMHVPIFIFTGGDPLKRPDLYELIRYGAEKGVKIAVTPSATPLLSREAIFKMKEAGVVRLGISLDGSTPEIHDKFRGLAGAWARTIQAIEWANEAGIPIQVHTTISRDNAHDLDNLCALFEKLAIVMWNVFFLVPVGRGQLQDLLSCEEFEHVFGKIYELSHRVSFQIKTTEAMHPPPLPVTARLETPHARPAPTPAAEGEYEPGAPSRRPGTQPGWPRGASTTARASCSSPTWATSIPADFYHPRRQYSRDAARRNLPQRAIFKSPARHQPPRGQVRSSRTRREICGFAGAGVSADGDPLAQEPFCIYQPRNWQPRQEGEPQAICQPEQSATLVSQ
jgi:pyruvate-formate lyase-activating enzyme